MVRKVSVEQPVRMVRGTLVLMNMQKRRLQERKRQHQVHHDGNARPHTYIVPSTVKTGNLPYLRESKEHVFSAPKPGSVGLGRL